MSLPPPASEALPRQDDRGAHAFDRIHGQVLQALTVLLGFSLVFPPAGVSIILVALAGVALLRPRLFREHPSWRQPAVAAGLALLAWIIVHTLWTSGVAAPAAWSAINKYHELLLPLLLVPLMARPLGDRGLLEGLAAGSLAYALLHWAALFSPELADYLLPRRIAAGWTFAISAFIFLVWADRPDRQTASRSSQPSQPPHHVRPPQARPWLWRAIAAFLVLTVLVAVGGRTGHLVVVVLMALASALLAARGRRLAMTGGVTALLLGLAALSPQVGERVQETLAAVVMKADAGAAGLDGQPLSSTGIRVQMLKTAADLLREHPVAGVGLTAYSEVHAAAAQRRLAGEPQGAAYLQDAWVRTTNPHNEFLMLWVGAGLPALLLFLGWLGTIAATARRAAARPDSRRAAWALTGLLLAFALGCLFNSLLRDFTEGHYFAVILSWLIARSEAA